MGYPQPLLLLAVEGQVELENIDSGLAEEAQRPFVSVLLDEPVHLVLRQAALPGDPGRLQVRVRRADVRVETAAGPGSTATPAYVLTKAGPFTAITRVTGPVRPSRRKTSRTAPTPSAVQ